MEPLCIIFYYALFLIAGYAALCLAPRNERRHWAEIVGLSGLLGAFLVGSLLFWASLAGIPPDGSFLVLLFFASVGILWVWKRRGGSFPAFAPLCRGFRPADAWMIVPGLVCVQTLTVVSVNAFGYPLHEWDAFAIWVLKARIFWLDPLSRLGPLLHDANLAFSHHAYPPLIPFLMSGFYAVLGTVNDTVAKALDPFLMACFGLLFFGVLREEFNRTAALGFTALALGLPGVVRWAGSGMADVPLMIFYGASVLYLLRWVEKKQPGDLLWMLLFTAATWSTKLEGFALGPVNLVAAAIFGYAGATVRPTLREWLWPGLLLALFLGPMLAWHATLPGNDLCQAGAALADRLGSIPEIARAFLRSLGSLKLWSGLWYFTLGAWLFRWLRHPGRGLHLLAFLLIAHLGSLAAAYFATQWELKWHLATSLNRVLLHAVPCAVLLCAQAVRLRRSQAPVRTPVSGIPRP